MALPISENFLQSYTQQVFDFVDKAYGRLGSLFGDWAEAAGDKQTVRQKLPQTNVVQLSGPADRLVPSTILNFNRISRIKYYASTHTFSQVMGPALIKDLTEFESIIRSQQDTLAYEFDRIFLRSILLPAELSTGQFVDVPLNQILPNNVQMGRKTAAMTYLTVDHLTNMPTFMRAGAMRGPFIFICSEIAYLDLLIDDRVINKQYGLQGVLPSGNATTIAPWGDIGYIVRVPSEILPRLAGMNPQDEICFLLDLNQFVRCRNIDFRANTEVVRDLSKGWDIYTINTVMSFAPLRFDERGVCAAIVSPTSFNIAPPFPAPTSFLQEINNHEAQLIAKLNTLPSLPKDFGKTPSSLNVAIKKDIDQATQKLLNTDKSNLLK
jgi:hypothetical protein